MSGGAHEYTMANEVNAAGTEMFSDGSGYGALNYPNEKYYDKYSYSVASNVSEGDTSRKKTKLGDAIREVYLDRIFGWYNGYSFVPSWFSRGGTYAYGNSVSLFFSNNISNGAALYGNLSSRLIIS